MPASFNRCVDSGGRVRTKSLSGGRYIHICFSGGHSYAGEVKHKKSNGIGKRKRRKKRTKRKRRSKKRR